MKRWSSSSRLLLSLFLLSFLAGPVGAQTTLVNTELEFAKGELAYGRKDFTAAQAHFANLVKRDPNNARAHYYLGASFFAQGKKDEAKAEFEKVVALDDPQYKPRAERYLAALEGKGKPAKSWAVNIATGFRYDSNLFLDPDSGVLFPDQDSVAWDVALRGAFFPILSETTRLGLEYTFFNALYAEHHGFNYNQHRIGGIYNWRQNIFSVRFNPAFSALFVESGGDLYDMIGEIPVAFRIQEGEIAATELSYHFNIGNYDNVGTNDFSINNAFLRDGIVHYPGVDQFFYFMEKRGFFQIGVNIIWENAKNPYDIFGPDVHARLSVPLPAEFQAQIYGGYRYKNYYHDNLADVGFTPNGIQRVDNQFTAGAMLKKFLFGPLWTAAGYDYLDNSSNEVLLDYHKHTATLYVGADL